MAYNPYSAINAIYNLKGQWDSANNAGDEKKKNEAATKAQAYYRQLQNNGYADVANELTASNYTQAKAIRDKWAKMDKTPTRDYFYTLGQSKGMTSSDIDKLIGWDNDTKQVSFGGKVVGTPDTIVDGVSYWSDTSKLDSAFNDYVSRSGVTPNSGVANPAYNQSIQAANDKNDKYFSTIESDHANINKKYDDIYAYANQDITKTDEYKSAFENIMPSYNLQAMQGRDNAVASGASANGGNIDSYAAANAMRQQAALTAKGQALAHQTGLESYEARVNNVRGILSDLGVYNSGVYSAMSDSINHDRNIANDIFNNEQTALNNEVARKSEIANVTGYAPDEWVVSNNPYLDDNGKLKEEYKDVDFSAIMANAKANGNTNAYNAAATARFYKIMGDYGTYGQYDDGNYIAPGAQRTAEYDLTQQQIESAERISAGDNASKEKINAANNAAAAAANATALEAARLESEKSTYAGYNVLLSMWPTNEVEKRAFVEKFIKPLIKDGTEVPPESLKQLIVENTAKYNIDVDDATKICQACGVPTDWLNDYRDRTEADGDVTWYDDTSHKGQYGGMVKK